MRQYSPVRFNEVSVEGAFWRERLDTVLTRTIPSQYRQLEKHGMLESLKRAAAAAAATHSAQPAQLHHPDLLGFRRRQVDRGGELRPLPPPRRRRSRPRSTRSPSGSPRPSFPTAICNCWYIGREVDKRWTNLRDNHELYCAGHMLEGAIAYFLATGRRRLLDIMEKYVDHIATRLRSRPRPEARLSRPPGDSSWR